MILSVVLSCMQLSCGPQSALLEGTPIESVTDPSTAAIAKKVVSEMNKDSKIGKMYKALLSNITKERADAYQKALKSKDLSTQESIVTNVITKSQCVAPKKEATCAEDLMDQVNERAAILLTDELLKNYDAVSTEILLEQIRETHSKPLTKLLPSTDSKQCPTPCGASPK